MESDMKLLCVPGSTRRPRFVAERIEGGSGRAGAGRSPCCCCCCCLGLTSFR